MTAETVTILASDEGKELIRRAFVLVEERCEPVRALTILRKTGKNAGAAAAAWDIARLRPRAIVKLGPIAAALIYDRDGYEMASSAACSSYHADIVCGWGVRHVVDLCGGVGIDALALAARGLDVTLYETDSARAAMARANAAAAGLSGAIEVRCEDVTRAIVPARAAAFFDPARRSTVGRKLIGPEELNPPLSFVNQLRERGLTHILAKLAPSSDRNLAVHYDGSIEFVSDGGECKEGLLRLGETRMSNGPTAVILPGPVVVSGRSDSPVRVEVRVGGFIYEPDPAVIRAGLVGEVASAVDGWLLDHDVAYVMSDTGRAILFADGYRVIDSFPFHVRRLQKALDNLGAGSVVIKKRAVPIEPAEIAKKLKTIGNREFIVFLTRAGKTLWCLIATRGVGLVE